MKKMEQSVMTNVRCLKGGKGEKWNGSNVIIFYEDIFDQRWDFYASE